MKSLQVRTCDPRLAPIKTFPILEASSLILPSPQTLTRASNFSQLFAKNLSFSRYFAGNFVDFAANGQICRAASANLFRFSWICPNFLSHEFCRICKEILCMLNCTIMPGVQKHKGNSEKVQTKRLPGKVNICVNSFPGCYRKKFYNNY